MYDSNQKEHGNMDKHPILKATSVAVWQFGQAILI